MIPATRRRGRRPTTAAPSRFAPRALGLVVLALLAAPACTTTSPAPAGTTGTTSTTDPGADVATPTSTPTGGATGGAPDPASPGDVGTDDPQAYADALFAGTNRVRADEGLPALTSSACALEAATGRAQALVGDPGLEHAPMDPVLAACAPATRAAENLSRASASAGAVVDAWMDSPGHRANLLSAEVTELGVACVPDGGPLVCSQIFLGP
ncbi:CAP domain-containing protein [uncultured Cellulomonas sp.]|uniref:CAP domain-containing protein n=1 Tax=uncultured Cellulomonas sp. TaxID=189682 RepID=UPI00260B479E|nr:CAP domain-containing protein [uncultured Cellulomonas sp.]